MAGIDEILGIIASQQKQTGDSIIAAARKKAAAITEEGKAKAQAAFDDYMKKAEAQLARELENAFSSVDAAMKRRLLACKVECIDKAVEKTVEKLKELPEKEYFAVLEKLAARTVRSGEGIISLGSADLKRVPADFESRINKLAQSKGGTEKLSKAPADIPDGFILTYGLISENCSFRAIIESEKEAVRDTAARVLFGQVS